MERLVEIAEALSTAVFVALGATCFLQWRRRRGEAAKWAALTFGVLAAVAVLGRVIPETGGEVVDWERKLNIAILTAFPYCLYRFAAAFDPGSSGSARVVVAATAVIAGLTLLVPQLPAEGEPWSPWFEAYVVVFLVQWTALSLFVAVKLWKGGQDEPTVVRNRMRVLSLGSVGLSLALIAAGAAGQAGPGAAFTVQVLGLASALLFFAGFAPPKLLVTSWRAPELEELQRATQGLVSARSPGDLGALLDHVAAVVGGRGAALIDATGGVLARFRVNEDAAAAAARALSEGQAHGDGSPAGNCMGLPLSRGWLVVWMTPYTPFFGDEELNLLRSLSGLFDVALERLRLADLEDHARRELERQIMFSDSLIRSTSDAILAFDREYRYTLWNPAMERLTGVPSAEVRGRIAFERFPSLRETGEDRIWAEVLKGNRFVIPERFFDVREMGVRGWFEVAYLTLCDDSGAVIGGLSVSGDVRVRKHAEALRTSLAASVVSSDGAILSKDLNVLIKS